MLIPLHSDGLYYIYRLVWNSPFCYLMGCQPKFLYNAVFLSLKIVFILANSIDPDEMLPSLGPQCLLKYLLPCMQNEMNRFIRWKLLLQTI